MSLAGLIGGQLLMGIRVVVDARQAVSGASQAERALIGIRKQALGANKAVDNLTRNLQRSLQGIGMAATMVGAAAAAASAAMVGGFLKPSYNAAKEFENALGAMRVVIDVSKSKMVELREEMLNMTRGTMFDPVEGTKAFTRLAADFGDLEESRKGIKPLLNFMTATQGQIGEEEAARTLMGWYKAFQRKGETMGSTADKLIKLANVSAVEFKDLPQLLHSMRDLTSIGNISLSEAGAAMGVLRTFLRPADAARQTTELVRMMNKVGWQVKSYAEKKGLTFQQAMLSGDIDYEAKQFIQAAQKLQVNFFDDQGNLKNYSNNLITLLDRLQDIRKTEGDIEFFKISEILFRKMGSSALAAFQNYIRSGKSAKDAFVLMRDEMEKSIGYAERARRIIEETPGGIEKKFAAAAAQIKISFGDSLVKALSPILQKFTELMLRFSDFLKENPAVASAIAYTAVALTGLFAASAAVLLPLGGLAMLLSFIIPALTGTGVGTLAAAKGMFVFSAATKAAMLNFAVLAGAFVLLYVAYKSFTSVMGTSTESVFSRLKRLFDNISLVTRGVLEFWTGTGTNKALYDKLEKKGLLGLVGRILQAKYLLKQFFSGVIRGVQQALIPLGAVVYIITRPFVGLFTAMENILELWVGKGGIRDMKRLGTGMEWLGWLVGVIVAAKFMVLASSAVLAAKGLITFALSAAAAAGPLGWLLVGVAALASFMTKDAFWDGAVNVVSRIKVLVFNTSEVISAFLRRSATQVGLYWEFLTKQISLDEFNKGVLLSKQDMGNTGFFDEGMAKADLTGSSAAMANAARAMLENRFGIDTSSLSDNEVTFNQSMGTTQELARITDTVRNRARLKELQDSSRKSSEGWKGPEKPDFTQNITVEVKIDGSGITDSMTLAQVLEKHLQKNLPKVFNKYAELYMTP
jgi:TP901 family phage tail tape measure protein